LGAGNGGSLRLQVAEETVDAGPRSELRARRVLGKGGWTSLMPEARRNTKKVAWSGRLKAVQPRIRLKRSWTERYHGYHGYVLRVDGTCAGEKGEFLIGVGKVAHENHQFRVGMRVSGFSVRVEDPRLEVAEFYRASGIRILNEAEELPRPGPPYLGVPPDLPTYRERGHRRLDTRTYRSECLSCIWGCEMPVEITVDQWNPSREYRFETFCYGPKSCALYRAGPTRKVPGRKGMICEEEDWIDEEAVAHRGPDD
jgi:hypothetical protein